MPGAVSGLRVLALALLLSGCSTSQIDSIPQEMGGLPANAPARPAEAPAFPAVHDMPPQRATGVLDAEQQKKLEADLIAVRNRQPNQQKNIAREKKKAERQAKAKANKANKDKLGPRSGKKKVRKPREQAAGGASPPSGAGGQATTGAPPWPLPPQPSGATARP
ncbi:hypothetical protein [Pseudorhodoplanes sp.]|uniref:hypothetical protein n=1 Tax=Pseudorhodoplanes sp. TaxID=1934341 RepID=UPI003D11F9F5